MYISPFREELYSQRIVQNILRLVAHYGWMLTGASGERSAIEFLTTEILRWIDIIFVANFELTLLIEVHLCEKKLHVKLSIVPGGIVLPT